MGKRQFFSRLIVCIVALVLSLKLFATQVTAGALPASRQDYRVYKLANFLASQNSPLVYYAPDFVYFADKYGLDYRLLPAIAGVESTFARNYIYGSYNAYGWGGGVIYFSSWADGIEKISAGLRNNYLNRGAQTVEQIGRIYCPPNSVRWTYNVQYFMDQIENMGLAPYLVQNLPAGHQELPLTI